MADVIRTESSLRCAICGTDGERLYSGLTDRLFGAPGSWTMKRCKAPACGLLWLDPRPTEEDVGKAYRTYYTHQTASPRPTLPRRLYWSVRDSVLQRKLGYELSITPGPARLLAAVGRLHPGGHAALEASVMSLAAPAAGSNLLDVGCGSGQFLLRMRQLGWKVRGVDTDPVAVEQATQQGIDVLLGDLSKVNLGERFDVITLAHVIEHSHDPVDLLRRCLGLLNHRGRLVMTTPNTASWGHRTFREDWRGLEPPRHLHIFNPSNMEHALLQAGLSPETLTTLAVNASAVLSASRAIRARRLAGGDGVVPWGGRLPSARGVLDQLGERRRLAGDGSAGEELYVVARRAGHL